MSLSSSAILDWYLCNFPWFFDWRHFPPKVYGRERFDLPHQQQDYFLRPRESICWNSPCLISPAQRPIEDITYTLFGYLALNEQPLLARLRPAGGTERILVIAESTKQFVLCKSIWPDFTLFVSTYQYFLRSRLDPVTIESSADRSKTSASMMRSRQVIPMQHLLCFRNWNSSIAEVLIIRWSFNLWSTGLSNRIDTYGPQALM